MRCLLPFCCFAYAARSAFAEARFAIRQRHDAGEERGYAAFLRAAAPCATRAATISARFTLYAAACLRYACR